VNAALVALLVTSTGAVVALTVWAVTVFRRTRSVSSGVFVVWAALLVGSDLLRVRLDLDGPSRLLSVLLALSLAGFLAAQVVLIRRLFGSWIGPGLDVFLTGMALVLGAWSLVLVPSGLSGGAGALDLLQFAAAAWLLAVAVKQASQLEASTRALLVAVYAFPVLHLVAISLLLARQWGFSEREPVVAVVLLAVAYVALALTVHRTPSAPPGVSARSTRTGRLLPYVLVLFAMLICLTTAFVRGEDSVKSPVFLPLSLAVAVALSIRQIVTAETNADLVDALAERERLYRSLVQDSTDLIMIADRRGNLEYVSPACEHVLGAPGSELVGRPATEVLGLDQAGLAAAITAAADGGLHQRLNSRVTVDGGSRSLESVVSVRAQTVVLNVRDVTESAELREQLHDMAFHDPLTGLSNRARLMLCAQTALEDWRANGGNAPALLFLDLDGFKGVNDVAGHAAGDKVLFHVAQRLAELMPEGAVLARLGGDEFAVLLRSATLKASLEEAERIAAAVSQSYSVEEGMFVIGVSVGVAHGADAVDADDLLRNADLAMYTAKRSHSSARAFEPAMHSAAVLRADNDVLHAAALDEHRTELHYQPIFSLDTELPVGVEALLRWRTEDGQLGDSEPLLEYAERSGRVGSLSAWVLTAALDQVAQWRDELGLVPVSVNLAPVELLRHGLVGALRDQLAVRGLPASVLTIEVTEQVLMRDPSRAIRVITDLRSLGIRVSIDDFGTGFSSLAYLVDLPVDALKIDRSFIEALPRTSTARVVVAGIIEIAHELGVVVVAEGIETAEQRALLAGLGSPLCQGFLFSPALPPDELADLITRTRKSPPLQPTSRAG
jgi:diguanylate cyclase (GGDEF)-like protein/PAS domain S-box-containing protein